MNNDIFYNVGTQDISNGLRDFEISSSQDYFIILKAPTNANITIKLNSNDNHEIPLKDGWQISSKDVGKMYLSCDAIEGESITYGQSDGNLIITPNPTINAIDTITYLNNLGTNVINQLEKIVNPYTLISDEKLYLNTQANTTIFNAMLDCDKFIFDYSFALHYPVFYGLHIFINDTIVKTYGHYNSGQPQTTSNEIHFELEQARGKSIRIEVLGTNIILNYCFKKYNLKA